MRFPQDREPGAKAGLQGDGTRRDRMGSEGYTGARLQLSPSPSRQQGCVRFVLLYNSLSCLGENCLSCACGFHLVWRCSTVIIRYCTAQFLSPHGIGCLYIRGVPEPVISVMVFLIPLLSENQMSLFKIKPSCQLLSPGRIAIPLPQTGVKCVKKWKKTIYIIMSDFINN